MILPQRIERLQQKIKDHALKYERDPSKIQLLAVSKNRSSQEILVAAKAGLNHFAESYWQEAEQKMKELKEQSLCWHFIGPVQSNKALKIARSFAWVHSLDRLKLAELFAKHRPQDLPALNVCLQVNLDREPSKAGLLSEELIKFALAMQDLPNLKLRGLMAIPKQRANPTEQFTSFLRLKTLLDQLNSELNLSLDTLSMGMSEDLEAAIRAGSTIVRIGRAIFTEDFLD